MMNNRRDLLKLFGVGAVIAPVAAGEVTARLVKVPTVEIIDPAKAVIEPGWFHCADERTWRDAIRVMDGNGWYRVKIDEVIPDSHGGAKLRLSIADGSPLTRRPLGL